MRIKYLGTAAAEGIPGAFCSCEVCKLAREKGGKYLRSRPQALIDGKILLDFNADTYWHSVKYGIDMSAIASCLITHSHSDHCYPKELAMRMPGFAHHNGPKSLMFYGGEKVKELMDTVIMKNGENCGYADFTLVKPFDVFDVEGYKVTALPANHDKNSSPLFYVIEKDGKSILYGHDTGYYFDEVWEFFAKNKMRFDLVSLDCTEANKHIDYDSHSNVERDVLIRDKMLEIGCANGNTKFVMNHFSHNGGNVSYGEFKKIGNKLGFTVTYDGMEIEA